MDFLASPLRPDPWILAVAVAADLAFGDPIYPYHPVRLIGKTLTVFEAALRRARLDGYGGGILLFLLLTAVWVALPSAILVFLNKYAAIAIQLFLAYSLLALRDLLKHGYAAANATNLEAARQAISMLVGRDTSQMDLAACRRAAIESVSENITDGFISPIFWYLLAGLPGLLLFKVVSTMDSMVGYKTSRYLRFGWCGARLDDVMNWIPARLTYLLIAFVSMTIPGCSARKALRIGWQQHGLVPGPNSGWSEATTAGALELRLVGPIYSNGKLVTELWLGDPSDPPAGDDPDDFPRAASLLSLTGILAAAIAIAFLIWL